MWFLNQEDKEVLNAAIKYLRLSTGHDSHVNIERHFGKEWWINVDRIRAGLEHMVGDKYFEQ